MICMHVEYAGANGLVKIGSNDEGLQQATRLVELVARLRELGVDSAHGAVGMATAFYKHIPLLSRIHKNNIEVRITMAYDICVKEAKKGA